MSIALNLYYNFVKKKPQVKIWVAMSVLHTSILIHVTVKLLLPSTMLLILALVGHLVLVILGIHLHRNIHIHNIRNRNDSDNNLHDSGNYDNDRYQVLPAPQYCAPAPLHLLACHLKDIQNFSFLTFTPCGPVVLQNDYHGPLTE